MKRAIALCLLIVLSVSTTSSAQLFRRFAAPRPSSNESVDRNPSVPLSKELGDAQDIFKRLWDLDLELVYDELPEEGGVEDWRIPYSGFDYADTSGGTNYGQSGSPMAKYDRAFNGGRSLAASWESDDARSPTTREMRDRARSEGRRAGPFAGRAMVREARGWYGHCNARTAASIRHAEPQKSVVRNGVTFTPSDIKALLCDIYMWSDTETLAGNYSAVTPAMLHVTLTNWLGRGSYPVGMDDSVGEQRWNFPIYRYEITHSKKLSSNRVEVICKATYAKPNMAELDESPRQTGEKTFHYQLTLDSAGKITGGSYYNDSDVIDLMWAPLQPGQGGQEGNEDGNPHVNTKEVLSIWRESVPEEIRVKWLNIDPTPEDAVDVPEITESEVTETAEEPAAETAANDG